MANTMFTPGSVLIRNGFINASMQWNSTDSEYHFNKERGKINPRYTENNVQYTYNSMGYRDCELSEVNKDFILCMGCSYTEGIGVDDNDTWPARLETHSGMDTFNMGLGGSSTMINLINSTQWINNPKKYPLPRCVVVQIPEASRTPRVVLKGRLASSNNWESSIEVQGTTPSDMPGQQKDDLMYEKWRYYRNTFPRVIPEDYQGEPDISPWFLTSALMTSLQTMWNAVGVPVLQMTYDDDGDIIYNPANVFRLDGEHQVDFGRDDCHQGPESHQLIVNDIWPMIQELLEWDGTGRQKRDIVRSPFDNSHYTMLEALAKVSELQLKKGGPFIYE
tara:strand:+ start:854 stop:1855 length:1002 start_codon:yes stop_codon:yes gene_type:complete